jgi:tRNA synthetases class I (M)
LLSFIVCLEALFLHLSKPLFSTSILLLTLISDFYPLLLTVSFPKILDKYPLDSIRYYLCASVTYGADLSFSEASLITMHNSELADILGNLVHRYVYPHNFTTLALSSVLRAVNCICYYTPCLFSDCRDVIFRLAEC